MSFASVFLENLQAVDSYYRPSLVFGPIFPAPKSFIRILRIHGSHLQDDSNL